MTLILSQIQSRFRIQNHIENDDVTSKIPPVTFGPTQFRLCMYENGTGLNDFGAGLDDESPTFVD